MDTLTHFSNYVAVENDSIWFAFGFKMDAIQVLSMDAAAIIQFSASDFKVAIVGIASASMPPRATDRREMFLYVELGLVAALDITGGSLTCQAQLTPNSFVLYPGKKMIASSIESRADLGRLSSRRWLCILLLVRQQSLCGLVVNQSVDYPSFVS